MVAKEYHIKTITDIVETIPADRIDAFMQDFRAFLSALYLCKESGSDLKKSTIEMVWIDDGKRKIKIDIIPEGKGK
jgi:hypothetical protein